MSAQVCKCCAVVSGDAAWLSRRQALQSAALLAVAPQQLQQQQQQQQTGLAPAGRMLPVAEQQADAAAPPLSFAYLPQLEEDLAPGQPAQQGREVQALEQAYDSYAGTYDLLDSGPAASLLGLPSLRQDLVARAHGRVLEVGIGTGLNLPLYQLQQVEHVTGLDLSRGMLREAQGKVDALGLQQRVTLLQGSVDAIPCPPGSFDCVLDTFSLCVFPNPVAALKQMRRALRPGGRLLLLEHSRSSIEPLGWYQDITDPAVALLGGKGCHWNQDIPALLRTAGLRVLDIQPALAGLISLVIAEPSSAANGS